MNKRSGKNKKKQSINAWPPFEGASANVMMMAKIEKLKEKKQEN